MLIDTKIMAKNLNSGWRPSAILEFLYQHIGPPAKSFRCAIHQPVKFCANPMRSFEDMWICVFLQNWLEMPIYAPKISVFWGSGPLKVIDHRRDPQKAHLHLKPRIMSVNAFDSVHICDL